MYSPHLSGTAAAPMLKYPDYRIREWHDMLKCVVFHDDVCPFLDSLQIERLLGVSMDTVNMHHIQT